MLDDLRHRFAIVLFWILNLPADLSGGAAFPNHRHVRRWQVPIRRSRRHVQTLDILVLMTSTALLSKLAFAIRSTPDVLNVYACVVTLPWEVAGRVAIETTRMFEHWNDRDEELACTRVITLEDCAAGCLGWKEGGSQTKRTSHQDDN